MRALEFHDLDSRLTGGRQPVVLDSAADAAATLLDRGGPVLGLLPDCTYEVGRVRFAAGSVLVAYSDGLTEACSTSGADWGEGRLIAGIRNARTRSAGVLADHLLADVTRSMADGPQQDDMTLLVARRVASA